VKQGHNVCEQGKIQNDLLILTRGITTLNVDGRDVHSLYDGIYAGEFALLGIGDGERCAYTLKAETDCLISVLSQDDFIKVLRDHKDEVDRIKNLGSDLSAKAAEALMSHPLFNMCPKFFIDTVANQLQKRTLLPDESLVLQHELWRRLIIIEHGVLEVFRDDESVMQLTQGRSMYELHLLGYGDHSEFRIQAVTICHVVLLEREDLGFTLMGHPEIRADIFRAGNAMKEKLIFDQKNLLTIAAEKRVAKRSQRAFQKVVRYTRHGKTKAKAPYQRTLAERPKAPHLRTPERDTLMQNIAQWCERRQDLQENARLKRMAQVKENPDDIEATKPVPSPDFVWTSASIHRPRHQWSMDSVSQNSSLTFSGAGSGSLARRAHKVVEMTTRATIRRRSHDLSRPRTANARVGVSPQHSTAAPSARSYTPDWALQAWGSIPTSLDAGPSNYASLISEPQGKQAGSRAPSPLAKYFQKPIPEEDREDRSNTPKSPGKSIERSRTKGVDVSDVQAIVRQNTHQTRQREAAEEKGRTTGKTTRADGISMHGMPMKMVTGRSEEGWQPTRPKSAKPAPRAPDESPRKARPETARRARQLTGE
jgi:CRP-like cAMP-binding protein